MGADWRNLKNQLTAEAQRVLLQIVRAPQVPRREYSENYAAIRRSSGRAVILCLTKPQGRKAVAHLDLLHDQQPASRHGGTSNSVGRALAILGLLNNSLRALSFSEIRDALNLPKSTTSLLLAFERLGYVTATGRTAATR